MANITLMGAQYSDVPAVNLPQTGGGLAPFYEYNWKGKLPEYLGQVYDSGDVALEDTAFDTWTPSTTAKDIILSVNAGTLALDLSKYEYLIKWETGFIPVLNTGATKKAQLIYEGADQYQFINKRPSSLANIQAENFNGNACITFLTVPFMRYYNTSGSATYTHSISYGIYPTLTAATFSNSTSNTPTLTIKTPKISARCSSTYFATARAAELDKAESKVRIKGKVWRIEPAGAPRSMYKEFYDRYNAEMG